jgi:glycosidase
MMATAMVGTVSAGDSIVGHFARVYDKNHLAEHPDQLVKEVRLDITIPKNDSDYAYDFFLQMKIRGRDKTLKTAGLCLNEGNGLRCIVECDGGGITLSPNKDGVSMFLDRITMVTCDQTVEKLMDGGLEVNGGIDDHEFRLERIR